CESPRCRRSGMLDYFGESYADGCGACDNCAEPVQTWDGTIAAQKALSCVYRTGQRFGATYLVNVLTGNPTERMERLGHDSIPTFGVGKELEPKQWHAVFRQLLAAGYLSMDPEVRRGFRLNEESRKILSQGRSVQFRSDPVSIKRKKYTSARKRGARTADEVEIDSGDANSVALWEALRELRLSLSKEHSVPPYVIFHDRTLKEMVGSRPKRLRDLLSISGVGEAKLDRYGKRFFDLLEGWSGGEQAAMRE
ncbi:MAG: ATP-dependent DNA helicase RecQ, partial [Rhodothermales bacterium]|nr:ATP-dependent DNA helicase RecQ [Rhodothermales bacterium]